MRALLVAGLLLSLAGLARGEDGRFELFELRRPIGEERWAASSDGAARVVTSSTFMDDRHSVIRLQARFREEKGRSSLTLGGTISRFASIEKKIEGTEGAFAIHTFAPYAVQRELVRAWSRAGRPPSMKRADGAPLHFLDRGACEVQGAKLERISLAGVVWGEETLYLDGDELVACVGWDVEADRFTAVRPDFVKALSLLEDLANKDQLARFAAAPLSSKPLAITGGTVLLGDEVVKEGVVVIEGDKVTSCGPRATTKVPEGAETIDASGKTVLPGLWDMHAHFEQAEWGPVYLAAGVTTARDMGNELEFLLATRRAIAEGRLAGPRLLVAGLVDASNGGWGETKVDSEADAKAAVEHFATLGFQQVKIYDSIQRAELRSLAGFAHAKGMTLAGHVPTCMNALDAVELGLDQISHVICARTFDPGQENRAIALYKSKKTVVDPTLAIYELVFRPFTTPLEKLEPGFAKVPAPIAANLEGLGMDNDEGNWQKGLNWIRALHDNGIPIVAGSDQAVPGHSLLHELELYVRKCGFTPREAIAAATTVPAKVMKREGGVIAKGGEADIVIIDGDPLECIEDIRKVWKTIAAGRVYEPGVEWERAGFRR